jgi:septum formation protein
VVASRYEEAEAPEVPPEALVLAHARGKAREVAARAGVPIRGAVLGADTSVVLDGRALGKPEGPDEAREMLTGLAGRGHAVVTAVALVGEAGERAAVDRTLVRFRPLDAGALDWYLATGEWRDRAGGYAIQGAGAALVERVEGDYTTVVGLPVAALIGLLAEVGLAPWSR